MSTTARTYRLPNPVCTLLAAEAEKQKTSEAEIVRRAIAQYFETSQAEAALTALEHRVLTHVDSRTQHLAVMMQHIISLATPAEPGRTK